MKKKITSIILFIVGAIFIIMGIVIPNNIERNQICYNYEKRFVGFDDKFTITITAGKQHQINSAELHFNNNFGDDLDVVVNGSKIKETKNGKRYNYTIEILIEDGTVDGIISGVDKLTINTSNGKIAVDYEIFGFTSKGTPIRVVCFMVSFVTILVGVVLLFVYKSNGKFVRDVMQDMKENHPEIDISSMGDDEIIKEWERVNRNTNNETFFQSVKNMITPKKTYSTCEYCGTQNNSENTKCEACGAKLNKK